MRPLALALALALVLALGPSIARAQQPPPAAPPATIDALIAQVADLRAKCAEIKKQEQAAQAELKLRLKELQDRLDKLGLSDPPAPVPPPKPVPPPAPADPLRAKLAAAFEAAAGTAEQKAEWARDLSALYRAAVKRAADPAVATAAALRAKLAAASDTLLGDADALKEVRRAVAGELAAVLPTADADLTADQRAAAAALFARLAVILDGLAQ